MDITEIMAAAARPISFSKGTERFLNTKNDKEYGLLYQTLIFFNSNFKPSILQSLPERK